MRARGAVVVVALCLAPALAPGAWAGEPADQLFASMDQVLKIVDDPAFTQPQERRQAFHRTAGEMFDFEEIARRSLGRHWEARTPAERDEFVAALRELLERLYISKVELYNGEKITLLGDKVDGDLATVKTKVIAKNGSEIPVDYRMIRRDERWRACDVLIAGVSLVDNYRAQFDKVIQRTSYQQLVKQVREKQ
jgi:phospholipid transport system substrate-binding protein